MNIAISIPDPLFKEAEAAAKDLGVSRSKLVQIALQAFLQRRRDEKVTGALNRSFARHPPENSIRFCSVLLSKG
jgi:metal-responsive CopG/Arc/MetJ family transcriptional regulator